MLHVSPRALSLYKAVVREFHLWRIPFAVKPCREVHGTHLYESGYREGPKIGRIHRQQGLLVCVCEAENALEEEETSCALLHELAHLIFEDPQTVREIESGMLAFEYATARKLRHPGWGTWMADYGTGGMDDWGYASVQARHQLLESSRVNAERKGVLSSGRITYRLPECRWFKG